MSDLVVDLNEFRTLSSETISISTNIHSVDVETALADAPSAMPGATSATSITATATTVNDRRISLENHYADFSDDVMIAHNRYEAQESNVEQALESAGHLPAPINPSAEQSTFAGVLMGRMQH